MDLTLSQIIDGYLLAANARRLSPHTIADYQTTFNKLTAFLQTDPLFNSIHKSDLERFLAAQPVSKKTLLNYHTGLSALWTWAYDEALATRHLPRSIERPRPEQRAIAPFTQADIKALLGALRYSETYRNHGATASNALQNHDRNRAIILLLLDTGLRADELCSARIQDCNLKNQWLRVFCKGSKERIIPICARTAQTLWKYLASRPDARPEDPLFITLNDTPLDRHRLLKQLNLIGKRAGVSDTHPHRFRHTFAINFLRNGGDIYSLQMILGHSTLDMTKKYLQIAQADIHSAHRLASPVSNWRL